MPKGTRIDLAVQDYVPYVKTKLAKHNAMTVISQAETSGIIAVNRAEQLPRATTTKALVSHDVARTAGRQAKANTPGTTAGHETALFEGGPVVVAPPGGPDPAVVDLEDLEPEMVVPVDETTIERLRREAKSLLHLRDHKPKNPYCDACQQTKKCSDVRMVASSTMDHRPQSLENRCPQTIWSVTRKRAKACSVTKMPSSSMTGIQVGKESFLFLASPETMPSRPSNTLSGHEPR